MSARRQSLSAITSPHHLTPQFSQNMLGFLFLTSSNQCRRGDNPSLIPPAIALRDGGIYLAIAPRATADKTHHSLISHQKQALNASAFLFTTPHFSDILPFASL
jgi:hypothetical protein